MALTSFVPNRSLRYAGRQANSPPYAVMTRNMPPASTQTAVSPSPTANATIRTIMNAPYTVVRPM
jgi:hypothetical protein